VEEKATAIALVTASEEAKRPPRSKAKPTLAATDCCMLAMWGSEAPGWKELHSFVVLLSKGRGSIHKTGVKVPEKGWDSERNLGVTGALL